MPKIKGLSLLVIPRCTHTYIHVHTEIFISKSFAQPMSFYVPYSGKFWRELKLVKFGEFVATMACGHKFAKLKFTNI